MLLQGVQPTASNSMWPILFLLYAADLLSLVEMHELQLHLYADETQIFGSCRPGDTEAMWQGVIMSFWGRGWSSVKFGERAFAVAAPQILHKLPCELKSIKCIASFKRLLYKILMNTAYNWKWLCSASLVYL